MKPNRWTAILFALCLQSAVAADSPAIATASTGPQAAAVLTLWAQLWDAKQIDALVALYEEGAVFYTADGNRVAGRVAIRSAFSRMLAARSTRLRMRTLAGAGGPGLAYESGEYDETLTEAGASRNLHGYYLAILRQQPEGQWLIAQQMWSEAPPPQAQMSAAPPPPGTLAAAAAPPPTAAPSPAAPPSPPESSMADVNIVSEAPPPPPRKPYYNTGCDRSLFEGPPPGKWQDGKAWAQLHTGMSMPEVEAAVGVEHYDEIEKGHLKWEYGRCGRTFEGVVVFDSGKVTAWNPPDR